MSKIRRLVVLLIIGLSALVVVDSLQAEQRVQSDAVVSDHCDLSGL